MSSSLNVDFNPVDFYNFASLLYKKDEPEAIYRTIIGRAYYAAFLCGREYAQIKNTGAGVHSEVIKYFQTRNRLISNNLIDLKDLRHKADYDLRDSVQIREAGESLKLAKKILTTLKYLP